MCRLYQPLAFLKTLNGVLIPSEKFNFRQD